MRWKVFQTNWRAKRKRNEREMDFVVCKAVVGHTQTSIFIHCTMMRTRRAPFRGPRLPLGPSFRWLGAPKEQFGQTPGVEDQGQATGLKKAGQKLLSDIVPKRAKSLETNRFILGVGAPCGGRAFSIMGRQNGARKGGCK